MKILQVVDQLNQGGTERVAVNLAILLAKESGIEVSFLCLLQPAELDKELINEKIDITYLKRKNKYNPFKLFKLLLVFNQFEIIHIHSRQVLRYLGLLGLFPLKRNYKLVFHDHYGAIEKDQKYTSYLKFCMKQTSSYIGVSETLVNWVQKNKLHQNAYVLPNIIRKRSDFKKNSNCGNIIVIGNFRPQKNYEFLCELISQLPNSIKVDLYGNPTDQNYYNKIVALANKLNISSRLNIIPGITNVIERAHNYQMGLHCAPSETGPLVAIEYLSIGLPFIMYQTGEVSKVIKKHQVASIMTDFNNDQWKKSIMNILNNQNLRERIANQNLQLFETYYSEKTYIEKCLKIYDDIQNF